jgi:RimJ/RimL family protein N-acetyltransferase
MQNTQNDLFDPELLLENEQVQLRIVKTADLQQLSNIAFNAGIWTYFTSEIRTEEDLVKYVDDSLAEYSKKQKVPFVIIDNKHSTIVGMTSFGNISFRDARIEIGWSWLSPAAQGTGINTAVKRLLSEFVFERLQMERLEFKTDVLNVKARKALIKIGAVEEGILRSHTLMPHNRRRDTIYYSILKNEWKGNTMD